jgi:apolipoprotein N-acyltransferase
VYHKVRLVPFGEWLPWFNVIPGFQEHIVQVGSFTPGEGPVVFAIPVRTGGWEPAPIGVGGAAEASEDPGAEALRRLEPPQVRFATSICFESVFSSLHRWMAREGADFLVNITNDAWYGRSSGPWQHFQIAVLRAVETGRPLVRCANTGITAVVSPAGRVMERLPFYEEGVLTAEVAVDPGAALTVYARWGDWWAVGCLVVGVAALVFPRRREGGRGGSRAGQAG